MNCTEIFKPTSIDEVKQMLKDSLSIRTKTQYNYGYGGEWTPCTTIYLILDGEVISEVDI